ncbi:hypothetical protein Pan216_54090 [Planctomycetes bacterium Pan216]|uniref:Esterase n=1 Tax=Kolteria novifilia TaxID=2527975 RepID=A0A518BC25_9BACT|nr:hypothetical protein Pan216_54090 [Planctomycetes bacterium Pan216]
MSAIARHVFHYRSSIDGTEQPYVVCAPEERSPEPLPVVFLLHDVLETPTPSEFTEHALREASIWLPDLEAGRCPIFVQPFGRGNGGWLGVGARDLFDVWNELKTQFPCEENAVSLLGVGAGATGALQLASWYPDCFSAVASIGAWTDDRQDLPLGASGRDHWERGQRQAMNPIELVTNLQGIALHLEHPWWFQGVGGTPSPAHLDALRKALDKEKIAYREGASAPSLGGTLDAPADRAGTLNWLTGHRRNEQPNAFSFSTYTLRSSTCRGVRIGRLSRPGKLASVTGKLGRKKMRLTTDRVDALSVAFPIRGTEDSLTIDKQTIPSPGKRHLKSGRVWVYLERLGRKWEVVGNGEEPDPQEEVGSQPIKSPTLPGPAMDLRWDRVLFVPGGLGDEVETRTLGLFAEELRDRWVSGEDSVAQHPGDRSVAIDYPIKSDAEVSDEDQASHHLVLLGTPKNHLLLARYRSALPCKWKNVEKASDPALPLPFRLGNRSYDDPRDVVFFCCPNPGHPDRYLLIISPTTLAGLAHAAKVQTAFLPDYLVQRGRRVLDWGYFGADWQIPLV